MSGHSYSSECPNCGGAMQSYEDSKPYDTLDHDCIQCGFIAYMTTDFIGLDLLNAQRADGGLPPLTELPEQKEEFKPHTTEERR